MLTKPSLLPSVVAATTATTNSKTSQMMLRMARLPACLSARPAAVAMAARVASGRGTLTNLAWLVTCAPIRWPAPRACAAVEVAVERSLGVAQVGLGGVELARQQRQAGVQQAQLEVFAQEEGLFGRHQHGLGFVDARHPHQAAHFVPDP
jgi:hypothetical protein